MQSDIKQILIKLQQMNENHLTRTIIIPLLETLGYEKVEFFGGPSEEGKDIVFWEVDKLGDTRLLVAQVKHFKFTNQASSSSGLQTVVNQLQNCFDKPLLDTNKVSHFPSEALLISTYPLDTKTLQTRFSNLRALKDQKIKLIDGPKLISLIKTNYPILISKILGLDIEIKSTLRKTLNNDILLSALGYRHKKDIKNIYTDIDFSLGKRSTVLFFNTHYLPSNGYINVELKDWLLFKSICAKTETEFSLPYIHDDLNKIEEDVREKQNHNHKWIKIINELTAKLEKETLNLNTLKGQEQKLKDTYRNKKKQKTTPANSNEGNSELVSLKAQIETSTEALQKIEIKIAKSRQNILSEIYKIKINGHKLANQLLEKRNWIEEKVQLFNSKAPNSLEIKNFIEKCKSVIDCASLFFAYPQFFGRAGFDLKKDGRTNFDSTRLKLPIANIFDTGLNILLLGEAGAGKSTSLQMYTINNTDNQQKLVVYIPLANALQHWHKSTLPFSPKEKLKDLDIGIASYLSLKGITITPDQFCLELSSKQTVILLDGLDEAIGQNPWLIDGIEHLAQKYKKFVQVIVTSRASGTYLDRLSFFAVTLLPFTEDQRNSFIDKWFDEETSENSETKERIKNHLNKNSSVSKVITNPLLTTTLCILANKDIKLPTTEIKLYDDRLNLYTGYYDRVKGIDRRIKSTPTNLELVARKLAFWLHEHQEREETKDVLIQQAITITSEGLSKQDAEIACLELIDPCNILIPMSDNGRFGFGHLQFQEHLVAKEIAMNRSIEILDLLNKQWWRGALIFFAHMNSDIYWLIHKVAEKSKLLLNEDILLKMLEVRPIKEQVSLRKMINTYSDSEENNTVKSFKISN